MLRVLNSVPCQSKQLHLPLAHSYSLPLRSPNRWARIRAELDARVRQASIRPYARRTALYILDPAEAMGGDYLRDIPGVLKDKKI
jgi:hypothetical protein